MESDAEQLIRVNDVDECGVVGARPGMGEMSADASADLGGGFMKAASSAARGRLSARAKVPG